MPARQREAVEEARSWLLDAFAEVPNETREEINLLNMIGVMAATEQHYEGGWDQFLLDTDNVRQTQGEA